MATVDVGRTLSVICETLEWPLLSISITGVADTRHSHDLLAALERELRKGRCAVVMDTIHVELAESGVALENMRREARWLSAHKELVSANVVAMALVVDHPAVRFLFSGLLSIAQLPIPWVVTTTPDEGRQFCVHALQGARAARPRSPAT